MPADLENSSVAIDWKRSVFIQSQRKAMPKNVQTTTQLHSSSHASKVMLKILQAMEKEMATHSSILAWKIPGMEDPGRLQSMGSQRVRHD